MIPYPKRLIEVDLPIKKISEHASREKSIHHGHISTLHIWWARRPLAACRAVICAALWPDPADPLCPELFRSEAKKIMARFWNSIDTSARDLEDVIELRKALLDYIADFAIWGNSCDERYLKVAQSLSLIANETLGGEPGIRPLVYDPFAGGGSIPLEALRVGADAYASDLNPVAVLLNKVILEYIQKYGKDLTNEVRKWGLWVNEAAEKDLKEIYPIDRDGAIPIAYLWARTIQCEGPGCGAEIPLIKSLWLAKKEHRSIALRLIPNRENKKVDFEIIENAKPSELIEGTVKRGSVTCPICGYTTPVASLRAQLKAKQGGTTDARMICVATIKRNEHRRFYRLPNEQDLDAVRIATRKLENNKNQWTGKLSLIPEEKIPTTEIRRVNVQLYGIEKWGDIFTPRQQLTISTFVNKITQLNSEISKNSDELKIATQIILALILDKMIQYNSSLCRWKASGETLVDTFGRQAIPMVMDFSESNVFGGASGDFHSLLMWVVEMLEMTSLVAGCGNGNIEQGSVTKNYLPNDAVQALITDPPYYDSVPYSHLSDFFYVWLKRSLVNIKSPYFNTELVIKDEEIVVDRPHKLSNSKKDVVFYEKELTKAFTNCRQITQPTGIAVVVFASKSTASWEAIIKAIIDSGWIITSSWPIDTEMASRVAAQGQARLGSSIHIVARPRENSDGSLREEIGEWSDVLAELPIRIREWMPRLKQENVVGADAIFACLGPALEIFSRYSRVEKASGEQVTLKEYLEKVWEAVEKEALTMIFEGADASGFEEDARLTAMWLWTLKAGANGDSAASTTEDSEAESDEDEEESKAAKPTKVTGYGLEYDAARKIAQGLGAHPEQMPTLIEIKKGNARLLSVAERAQYLFGKEDLSPKRRPKKRETQMTLFPGETVAEEPVAKGSLGELTSIGKTTLDRVHQSMLLFGNGQSDALKRFLVDEGIGKDQQFKKLAQALVALYPAGSDEKRWAEGVMSRMKGLGQ